MTAAPGDLSTTDLGYLNGGSWGAVRAALVMLHGRGSVSAARPGALSRTGSMPAYAEPLERALFAALYGSMSPCEVASQRRVRQALAEQREGLIGLGLLRPAWRRLLVPATLVLVLPLVVARLVTADLLGVGAGLLVVLALVGMAGWFLPRLTLSGGRTLRDARREHPLPVGPDGVAAGRHGGLDPGLAVALYGTAGLPPEMRQFARDVGLLDGGTWSRFVGDSTLNLFQPEPRGAHAPPPTLQSVGPQGEVEKGSLDTSSIAAGGTEHA
ncbi:TIGR04222 domain-containing membrane protein [Plantactinospora sp. B6F1]|uniref:TIGR04222 domain-containing membrane protein n=1 Tax=Plantactinospora sp. B6F1 TaxID=3158971 RepID=UPI00102CC7CA